MGCEYLVWLTQERTFRWYILQEEKYGQQHPDGLGILQGISGVAVGGRGFVGGEDAAGIVQYCRRG